MISKFTMFQSLRERLPFDRRALQTFLVVSCVLLIIPPIVFLYVRGRFDPLLVGAGIVGVITALRLAQVKERGNKGIVLLLVAAGTLSFVSLPTGRESRIPLSMVVAMALVVPWLLSMGWGKPPARLRPSPINRPLIAFIIVGILAYLWSLVFRDPLLFIWSSFPVVQLAALTVNSLLPLTLLYVANQITDVRWLKYMVGVVLLIGVASLVFFFFAPRTGDLFFYRGTRGLFSMWVAAFAYGLALFHKDLKLWQRALLLIFVALLVYRYFFIGMSWVSGWLPLGVACMAITGLRSRRLFIALCAVGLVYLALNFDFYYQNIVIAEEEGGSGTGRVELWMRNLNHVVQHPLFGMGPAGYAIYNMTYHSEDARSTHNNYFDILAQTGVIGFTFFVVFLMKLLQVGRQTLRRYSRRGDFEEVFAAVTLSGVLGAMVGMMLGDWMLPFAYNETIAGFDNAVLSWVMFGGMVALGSFAASASPQKEHPLAMEQTAMAQGREQV
ncbi:MAG: O-antigen polymerase [Caldilinea sp.]|uniref:O-antigen polymerase family protein n=2 Tax=Caldilineaceae TaxID=475964 RepID=I0I6D2_CALAS|nr:O-antigen polymerase family protein [Caldilinea aerophila DSM 14535 = NBRC 104270]GIV72163.1 MAG: O-antigen polymerase [Caldilinea sp.]